MRKSHTIVHSDCDEGKSCTKCHFSVHRSASIKYRREWSRLLCTISSPLRSIDCVRFNCPYLVPCRCKVLPQKIESYHWTHFSLSFDIGQSLGPLMHAALASFCVIALAKLLFRCTLSVFSHFVSITAFFCHKKWYEKNGEKTHTHTQKMEENQHFAYWNEMCEREKKIS